PNDCGTADGRPATRRNAHARLARMLGGDSQLLSEDRTTALAQKSFAVQGSFITNAILEVSARLPGPVVHVVIAGSGEFLAQGVVQSVFPNLSPESVTSVRERFG